MHILAYSKSNKDNTMRNGTLILLIVAITMLGCAQRQSEEKPPEKPAGKPEISFLATTHDFGTLEQGEKVAHTFRFVNTGDGKLLITNALASCGCTVPKYTMEPIAPGDTGRVEVVFNTGHFVGNQFKSLKVFTNAPKGDQKLTFKAFIEAPEVKSSE